MTLERRVAPVPSVPRRVGLAVATFNQPITEPLAEGALPTVRQYAHAVERSRPGPGNKGAEAAQAAVATARTLTALGEVEPA